MTLSRIVALNTLAQYFGKAIGLVAGVVVTAVLTRRLGIEGYGNYVYVYTIVLFVNALADWGSTFIATREASRAGANQAKIFGNTLLLKLGISVGLTSVLLLASQYLEYFADTRQIFLIAALLIPFLAMKTFFQVIFQSRLELWKLSLIDTISSLIFLLGILYLPSGLLNLQLIFTYLLISVIFALAFGWLFLSRGVQLSLRPDIKVITLLARESAVMGILLTVFSLYNRLDIIILERFQGSEAVGIYGLSYKIYENLVVGAAFFANTTFPILAARSRKIKFFRRTLQKVLGILLISGVVVGVLAIIFARPIILIVAGEEFGASILPLQILALSLIVAYLNHATGYSLVALNRQATSMIIAVVALIINLSLNWTLVPRYSYLASAGITLITELFVLVCSLWVLSRITGRLKIGQMLEDLQPGLILKKLLRA